MQQLKNSLKKIQYLNLNFMHDIRPSSVFRLLTSGDGE